METQREALRQRFIEELFRLSPASVLDIGSGDGALPRQALDQGVFAVGLEVDGPRPGSALSPSNWVRASADALPFRDASFDWVTLRHVPHHLPKLGRALAEAWRVARGGLLIAEPWYDESLAEQRFALRADRWLKRQDRRHGRFHGDVLSAEELLARIPGQPAGRVETFRPDRPWTVGDLELQAAEAAGGLAPEREDESELESLLSVARRGRMSLNGTLILTIEKG